MFNNHKHFFVTEVVMALPTVERKLNKSIQIGGCIPFISTPSKGPDVADSKIEYVVRELNVIGRAATLEFAWRVGKLIIDNIFAGNMDQWRSRNSRKHVSLRKLSRHPNLPMSASALYRTVCIYEICERLDGRQWKHLSTSHVRSVLALNIHEQDRLLRMAEANAWSVRELEREIQKTEATQRDRDSSSRGGRRRHDLIEQTMSRVEDCSYALAKVLAEPDGAILCHFPDSATSVIDLLHDMSKKCRQLEERFVTLIARQIETRRDHAR
jgi:hypothetical protein